MTIIEIRPRIEMAGKSSKRRVVEPVFLEKDEAINYAENRASFRSGEIRILDSSGNLERTIPFNETDRKPVTAQRGWSPPRNLGIPVARICA